jgi:hypothetical protein
MFSARIPFNNGVQAAAFEAWAGQTLFPDLFLRFLAAVQDGSSGEFVHPVYGTLTCKARDVSFSFAGSGPRDGAEISCRFVHSNDDPDELSDAISQQSPMSRAQSSQRPTDQTRRQTTSRARQRHCRFPISLPR